MKRLILIATLTLLFGTAASAQTAGRLSGGPGVPNFPCNPGSASQKTVADTYIRTDVDPHVLYICSSAPSGWTVASGSGGGGTSTRVERETPSGAINGSNTTFVLAVTPTLGSEEVFWNGQLLTATVDYTISAATISTAVAPQTGDAFVVSYETGTSGRVVRSTPSGAVDGSNPTFVLAAIPTLGSEEVYLNGFLMTSGVDYTISGATITMLTIPETGDYLRVSYVP